MELFNLALAVIGIPALVFWLAKVSPAQKAGWYLLSAVAGSTGNILAHAFVRDREAPLYTLAIIASAAPVLFMSICTGKQCSECGKRVYSTATICPRCHIGTLERAAMFVIRDKTDD